MQRDDEDEDYFGALMRRRGDYWVAGLMAGIRQLSYRDELGGRRLRGWFWESLVRNLQVAE